MIEHVEAIVLSEDHYNALGVVRSLGLAKIPVRLVLTEQGKSFCDKSRYVSSSIKVANNEKTIIDNIVKYTKDVNTRYFLFPLNDVAAQLVSRNISRFKDNIICPTMNRDMKRFSDKTLMKGWAKNHGLNVPKGRIIDLYKLREEWNIFPAIMKPKISVEGIKSDIVTAYSIQEYNEALKAFKKKGYKDILIEEFICGNDEHMIEIMGERSNKNGCSFAGIIKKIREFPIHNGSTSFARIVQSHIGIELSVLATMMDEISFNGLFDFEFKYANGKAYFIECNFRNGAPGWAFTKIGKNLPLMWICGCIGIPITQTKILTNKDLFMCEHYDIINMLKKDVGVLEWLENFFQSSKVLWLTKDIIPVLTYYYIFVLNRLKK